ncbi:MAG TPA: monofunctional biosynthetic peptidoglycan transglycosylase [Gracilimonas sp.]|uniref:monofunctional biosynthetic peptidoglycan transglycosylase n=1 Tax=Gracilimonas sp. TaxID=1974203 RepID=UPI002D81BC34|nr:monofunctional biosynthetic peptidoglycan transglycosylase [Gracilimonas sp.]
MEERASNPWKKYGKITTGVLLGWSFWFCFLILVLRWVNPPFTAFTLQEDWEELGKERYSLRETWVPDEELPDHLKLALIASEDQRFYEHWGLDPAAIEDAMEEKEQSGRVRGASTITQQVAKNLFLSPAQNYFRKALEAGIAVLIELFWTKDRIMEVYFNIAEFGPGMFGVGTAADFYYGKPVSALTPKESARMVTVLPNPKIIEPEPASDYVLNRSDWILRNMEQLSGIQFLPRELPDSLTAFPDSLIRFDSLIIQDSTIQKTKNLSNPDTLLYKQLMDSLIDP